MNEDVKNMLAIMKNAQRYCQKELERLKESHGFVEDIELYEQIVKSYEYKIAHIQQIEEEFNAIRAIIQNSEFSAVLCDLVRNGNL